MFHNMSTRDRSIDIFKGIGIIFVVFGHVTRNWSLIDYIWGFHMPLFFFASGFLFTRDKYDGFLSFTKHRINRLIIPYFFFSIIGIGICYISIHTNPVNHDISLLKDSVGILYGNMNSVTGALWFLTTLFVLESIFYLISFLNNKYIIFFCAIILHIIGLLTISTPYRDLPWGLNLAFIAMPFYALGYTCKKHINRIQDLPIYTKIIIIIATLFLSYLFLPITKYNLSMHIFRDYYGYIPIALIGITTYLTLAKTIKKNKYLEWLGKNTIVYIALHGIVYQMIIYVIFRLSDLPMLEIRQNLVMCVIITFLDFLILYPFVKTYNRWVAPQIHLP